MDCNCTESYRGGRAVLTQFGDVTVPAIDKELPLERAIGAACTCVLPWAKEPCSNMQNPLDPDSYCAECRDALDQPDETLPREDW